MIDQFVQQSCIQNCTASSISKKNKITKRSSKMDSFCNSSHFWRSKENDPILGNWYPFPEGLNKTFFFMLEGLPWVILRNWWSVLVSLCLLCVGHNKSMIKGIKMFLLACFRLLTLRKVMKFISSVWPIPWFFWKDYSLEKYQKSPLFLAAFWLWWFWWKRNKKRKLFCCWRRLPPNLSLSRI